MTGNLSTQSVTKNDIIEGLNRLGISAGMGLMVHSSLKSFGGVEGGAGTVIEALMEVLTDKGTLMMPSFNHGEPFLNGGAGYYSPKDTPTINGIIPDTFWRMSGVYRSMNPTHAFAAWGMNAKRYLEYHHHTLTMGPKSPLGLLCEDGGWCLLIGVDYNRNTMHHVVEMSLSAPCLGQRSEAYTVILPDGRKVEGRTWGWRDGDCPFTDMGLYGRIMRERGLERVTFVGNSKLTFFNMKDCFNVIAEILSNGMDGFPPCSLCQIRPRIVPETVSSDWDSKKQCLRTDSVAWNY